MSKLPSLLKAVALSAILAATGGVVLLVATTQHFTGQTETIAQAKVTDQAAKALQFTATRLVQREWDAMSTLAPRFASSTYTDLTSAMTSVETMSDAVSWAGLVNVSGDIIAGSGGIGEGSNVANLDWFAAGLQEGGVHVTLAESGTAVDGGAIHLSIPATTAEGVTQGVLIYSIDIAWLDAMMREGAEFLEVDYAVVTREGEVVLQSQRLVQAPYNQNLLRLVAGGDRSAEVVTSSQYDPHVVSMLSSLVVGTVPDFGWGIVVRAPAYSSPSSFVDTLIEMRNVVIGLVAVILICAAFFAVSFLMPIRRLARVAKQMVEGDVVYPSDNATSREAAEISEALVRLQSAALNAQRLQAPLVLDKKKSDRRLRLVVGQN
ncbi:hypothetical protein AN191_13895 [Loktanella sp. 5RATIMAR09]|uniref:cache domain-containing protein n=1 Tax=Loktanella sp. 5RATIMAR09 TaxID=1225655 RepID=UPI0006EB63D8|nr:cache domain-containing protein [Loktanella sp. 5RATIMAR09]KQI71363.1 hypothetical protein AN191_13895 [Loktanella sp. 5RATIMAR09]